jgi:tetratricopeptide (TPR) repeat protein
MLRKKKKKAPHFTYEVNLDKDEEIDLMLEKFQNQKLSADYILGELHEIAEDHYLYPTVFYAIGVIYGLLEQYDKAIFNFTKAIKLNPFFVEAMFNSALSHQKIHDIAGQLILLTFMVEVGNKDVDIVQQAKEILHDMQHKIESFYNTDLQSYLKNARRFKFALEQMQFQKWDTVIPVLKSLSKKTPQIPSIWNNLALCYAYKGNKDLAREYSQKAIKIEPNYKPAQTILALIDSNQLKSLPLPSSM